MEQWGVTSMSRDPLGRFRSHVASTSGQSYRDPWSQRPARDPFPLSNGLCNHLANYEMDYEIVLANYEMGYEIAWQIMKWVLPNYETGYEIAWQIMKLSCQIMKWVMKSPGKL